MDINKKFNSTLLKNGVIEVLSCDKAIEALQSIKAYLTSGHKIGLYGVGIEAEGLLHFILGHIPNFKIDVCFDQLIRNYKYKNIIRDAAVKPIECILNLNVDCVILGSYLNKQLFFEELNNVGYQGRIIDLFDYLEGYIDDHYADYRMAYETRQAYLGADGSNKIELLQKLIKEYLLLKDFENSFYYIEEYISNHYPGYEQYKKLQTDLKLFLQEIKEYIAARNKRDIIINWVDALSYYDIYKFPFLQQKAKGGVCFENAYTVMPWTTETTKTILYGEYPIEGKLFLKEQLSKDTVKLLRILSENGYGFGYCGMPRVAKLFDEWVIAPVACYDNKYSGSMQKQWDALGILCQSETPMCILIHSLRETHEPFICGEGDTFIRFGSTVKDWSQELCIKQADISGKYIDKQIAFYEKYYGENAIEIYMSDHGRVGNSPMNEKKIHTMLIINGRDFQPKSVTSMFSLVKFPELIQSLIMNADDWNNLTDDYVVIQNLDAYDDKVVQDTLSGRLSRDEMYQCRGIVTLTDKYFLYAYGKEYYYNGQENQINEIDNPQYKERIQKLRKLCGDEFIDIFQFDKFKYSRSLYNNSTVDLKGKRKDVN